jgi:hypothetical protein
MTDPQTQPAPPRERLAFSLRNDEDDLAAHGKPTVRIVIIEPDDSHEGTVHLDLPQLKLHFQQVQRALSQLQRATAQHSARRVVDDS